MQLYATCDSASTNKIHKGFLLQGACWSRPVAGSLAVSSLWPYYDPMFTAGGQGASRAHPAIINSDVTPRCLPGALWLGKGRGHSATRPSCGHALGCWQTPQSFHCAPFSLPASGTRWQNQRQTVSLLLSNHRKSLPAGARESKKGKSRHKKGRKKKTDLERIFLL